MNQKKHFEEQSVCACVCVCVCTGMNGNCTVDQWKKESLHSKI